MSKAAPYLPYGRQCVEADDLAAVAAALASDWLTTGPRVAEFEAMTASCCGSRFGVAVSSGTAALHAAMHAIAIGPGDEVIVPAMTFAATANCAVYQGATPVFADVEPDTLLIDLDDAARRITDRTRAVIAVDYAGQPCDYDGLRRLADRHRLRLVADACHSLGGGYRQRRVGTLADCTVFSFHPVKQITTGEGGMVLTDDEAMTTAMRRFRNHGIDSDHRQREEGGTWEYAMVELGFNYRITDFQCALGVSQLRKLPGWLETRRQLAGRYHRLLAGMKGVTPLRLVPGRDHAWHLFVVRLGDAVDRGRLFRAMRGRGIGVNVHYLPVHLHPFYQKRFRTGPGLCPVAEAAYERILTLPLHQGMTEDDVDRVVAVLGGKLAG